MTSFKNSNSNKSYYRMIYRTLVDETQPIGLLKFFIGFDKFIYYRIDRFKS